MLLKDFEQARREGMVFVAIHKLNAEVLSIEGRVKGDHSVEWIYGVWDEKGRFFALMQQPDNEDMNLVVDLSATGVYATWNGRVLVRTPFFDLQLGKGGGA